MVALLLGTAHPARANLSMGDITDAIRHALEHFIEQVITKADNLPAGLLQAELDRIMAAIGGTQNGYLGPAGANLDALFPDQPEIDAPDDASQHDAARLEDRKARVAEAMTVASGITQEIPANERQLDTLQALNASPAGIFATLQVGNEIALSTATSLQKQNALLAELGQIDADQHAQEDWARRQQDQWDRNHYGASGFWSGARSWTPETIPGDW
jgi:P-type conjugative transfer protein TrbJ